MNTPIPDGYPQPDDNGRGSSQARFDKREKRRNIRQLQGAIKNGDISTVEQVLKSDFDIDFQYSSQTSLQLAVCQGAHQICAMLIKKGANVNQADANGNSLLNMASWRGFSDVVQLLVDSGANLDTQNEDGNTPLHACVMKGFPLIAKVLLKAGSNANLVNNNDFNPLHIASQHSSLTLVQELLQAGADPNWINFAHITPMMMAAKSGNLAIIQALINFGANVNLQSRQGSTATLEAAEAGHKDVLEELIKHQADLNLYTKNGQTPLIAAITNDHCECAKLLIQSGCDVNIADRRQQIPLHILIRQISSTFLSTDDEERHKLVHRLVDSGADLDKIDAEGCTSLYLAFAAGDIDLCNYFLKQGASVHCVTHSGSSMLHAAVYSGKQDIVRLCLDTGCPVNSVNQSGQHALLVAVSSRCNIEILKMLLEAGSDVHISSNYEKLTALHEAVAQHYEEAAKLLIHYGSDLRKMNLERKTPLYMACHRGLYDTVSLMLSTKGCPMSSQFPQALPIHAAATHGRSNVIQVLAEHGCNLNEMNEKGETPLMAALAEDSFPSARALIQYGCDLEFQYKVKGLMLCCLHQEDRHPHVALEPLFLAMTHKNMDTLKMLLACYRQIPRKMIHLIATLLRKAEGLATHYTESQKREILSLFSQSLTTPFSLQDACRRCVRSCLTSPIQANVKGLPVGDKVKKYILMEHDFDIWKDLEQEMPGGSFGFSDIYIRKDRC